MPKILVVEDDGDLRFLYNQILSRGGYEVATANNTSDGILLLTTEDYDLIILDMNMPDIPGIRLLEFVRDDVRLRQVPVLVISANEHWKHRTMELGVQHFMVKPLQMQQLLDRVELLLAT